MILRCHSDGQHYVPNDACLFVDVVVNGNRVKRSKQFTNELTGKIWRLGEVIELSGDVLSARLIVVMEHPRHNFQQLGLTNMISADLIAQCEEANHEFVRALTETSDEIPLDLVFCYFVVPPDIVATPDLPRPLFEDATEEEIIMSEWALYRSSAQIVDPNVAMAIGYNVKYERTLALSDQNSDKPSRLKHIGALFYKLYNRSYNTVHLDTAIAAYEAAVKLAPDDPPFQIELYNGLGTALDDRFDCSPSLVDIDKAISAHQHAAHLDHADRLTHMDNSASSLARRFGHSRSQVDIDEAISIQNQVVNLTPDGRAGKHCFLNNLGNSLVLRFQYSGDPVDNDNAISALQQSLHLIPDGSADKPRPLSNIGTCFMHRFELSGNIIDIDQGISAYEQALELTPGGHLDKPNYLNNLGSSFASRFRHFLDINDMDRAISTLEKAVDLFPDGHFGKTRALDNLGTSLSDRFDYSEDLADIAAAITAHERALHLIPDGHISQATCLNNLGVALTCSFRQSKEPNHVDIDNSISTLQRAVYLIPDSNSYKAYPLSNLGTAFAYRFEHSSDLTDIDRAISAHEQALHLTPDSRTDKLGRVYNLGLAYLSRFDHSTDLRDSAVAISHFHLVAISSTGSPSFRLRAALQWARLATKVNDPSAFRGYSVAIELLPRIAWLGQTTSRRHEELVSVGHVTSEAAAVAIDAERYETALEWLEQGRSIVWTQLLSLRTPVDALHEEEPSLADEIIRVSRVLEHAGSGSARPQDLSINSDQHLSIEQVMQHQRRLAKEWETLMERARAIQGFEDFLQPKKFSQLLCAAKSDPVVVINVDERRCDALVLMAGLDEAMHIPLDKFSFKKAQELHWSLDQILLTAGVRQRDTRGVRRVATTTGSSFPSILSDLWSYVVNPVLDGLAMPESPTVDPPRIWWCATGPLALLPIHAAGIYTPSYVGINISDFVVSSYTPTLNAIINASENHKTFRGLLAVSQSNTPGQSALPNTTIELTHIQNRARNFDVHSLEGPAASVQSVIEGMQTYSWVHLACHALQDPIEPTRSALCLHDGSLHLSTIIIKSFPHADFAFLSACQTATGDEKIPDEAAHFAAGLMMAGYNGVIATMWSIQDRDAPVIADHVYSALFSDIEPNSTKAALALHHAVKSLRQQVGHAAFLSWVPFIHVGI